MSGEERSGCGKGFGSGGRDAGGFGGDLGVEILAEERVLFLAAAFFSATGVGAGR